MGRSFNVASVMIPSIPSLPHINPVRSKPTTFFAVLPPVRITSPVAVTGGPVFRSISAGSTATVALDAAGAAYGWGFNSTGQLGDGTTTHRSAPTAVSGGQAFRAICTGGSHTVALAATGTAYAWGGNSENQLGDGLEQTMF